MNNESDLERFCRRLDVALAILLIVSLFAGAFVHRRERKEVQVKKA